MVLLDLLCSGVQVFGSDAASAAVNTAHLSVEPPRPGSDLSARLCAVVQHLRTLFPGCPACFVVMQGVRPVPACQPLRLGHAHPLVLGLGSGPKPALICSAVKLRLCG